MRAVIVDTDVASFLFKQDTRAALYTPHLGADTVPGISFMTLAEMEQWAVLRNWGAQRRSDMLRFVAETFVVIDSNEALCKMWGEVKGHAKRAGRQIETADAWVAATAMLYGAELVTHNASDYDFLPGLQIITEA